MKWIFLLALLALTPVVVSLLRERPRRILFAGTLIGMAPFALSPLHLFAAPISWAGWPGPIKGVEISVLDALAVAIILTTKARPSPILLKLMFGVVALAVLISTLAAKQAMPSIFYAWQLFRTVILYVAVVRATSMFPEFPFRVLTGFGFGMAYEVIMTFIQRAGGAVQAGGSFGHQNLLGMVTFFIVFPAFSLLVAGRRVRLALLILVSEALIAFAGGSRATIGLLGAGILLTLALSLWHRQSGRKMVATVSTLLIVAAATPVMLLAIDRRPEAVRQGSLDERGKFEDAAQLIIDDHPLGVGANEYVVTANLGGYSDRAGVPWNYSERSAPVHNVYYLITAEMGWLGLFGFGGLLISIILVGLRGLKRTAPSESSEILVGLVASSIITTIHFKFEWVPMLFQIHYLIAINAGMLVAIATTYPRRAAARAAAGPARQAAPIVGEAA